jgi:hypothetical protein
MDAGIVVPVTLFAMIMLIVYISVKGGTDRRKAILGTVEEAIKAGQQLSPELVESLGVQAKKPANDLKTGAILLAVAAALVTFGTMVGGIDSDSGDAQLAFTGIAAFPGFIGLVLIAFGLIKPKNSDES